MAQDDIYGSKGKYERFMSNLEDILRVPGEGSGLGKRIYFCRNRVNLCYFKELHRHFESRDTSYIRRNRVFQRLVFLTYATAKDLAACDRTDVDAIVALGHRTNRSLESKRDFLALLKQLSLSLRDRAVAGLGERPSRLCGGPLPESLHLVDAG